MRSASLSPLFSLLILSTVTAYPSLSRAGERPEVALAKMVERAREYGPQAAFVFDLDETTVDSSPRRFESLREAIDEACSVSNPPADCRAWSDVRLADLYRLRNRYDISTYLRHYGARDEALIESIAKRTFEIYLSGKFIVERDRLFVGARAFLRAIRATGAQVYYVSSRSLEHQGPATLRFLREHGILRTGEENLVYLKPDGMASPDFKRRATQAIAKRVSNDGGRVFGIFENEPENLEIWIRIFPRARAFFMEGAYQHEGPVAAKAVLLEDYRFSTF